MSQHLPPKPSPSYRRNRNILVQSFGQETLVHDRVTGETHLLQAEHKLVLDSIESLSPAEIAGRYFSQKEPEGSLLRVEALLAQLLEKDLVRTCPTLKRRDFARAAALALPMIVTVLSPLPVAADSLGMWDSDIDGMVGSNSVSVPSSAMAINFTVRGGSGGGGGGGGFARDNSGGTRDGADGGIGAFGREVTGSGVAVTGGSTLTVNVGSGGMGGMGGGDGMVVGSTFTGGAGGLGGGGAPSGNTGNDGGGDADLARGGGGGGGGRGGDSQIVGIPGALAAGGTGGGGGEGGMGSMGMVSGTADPGSDGNAMGTGGASGGTATDGGNGGGFPVATPTGNSLTGLAGAGSTGVGGAGEDGGDGEDGRVIVVFCP